jgi:hypothetical protein
MVGFAALELAPSLEKQAGRVLPGVSWHPNPENHIIYRAGLEQFRKLYTAFYKQEY